MAGLRKGGMMGLVGLVFLLLCYNLLTNRPLRVPSDPAQVDAFLQPYMTECIGKVCLIHRKWSLVHGLGDEMRDVMCVVCVCMCWHISTTYGTPNQSFSGGIIPSTNPYETRACRWWREVSVGWLVRAWCLAVKGVHL